LLRHAVAIVVGYLCFGLASASVFAFTGHDPHLRPSWGFAFSSTLAGMIFAGGAGFLAAIISPFGSRASRHLALAMAILALMFAAIEWSRGSIWSELTVVFLIAPCAAIGGWVYDRRGIAAHRKDA
jgi:hypothetical protein